jgi:Fe-S oxidoreductase
MPIRLINRPELSFISKTSQKGHSGRNGQKHRILYFAGCMSHLTPSIIRSMTRIFNEAGSSWRFYDADGQSCCGRPLKLAGQSAAASGVREMLQADFVASGAELLVTSCPICYRMFKEDYVLPGLTVMHHTQYIQELLDWKRIRVDRKSLTAVYHEPCELGRGAGVTVEPRKLIENLYGKDLTPDIEGLCCGGSLGGPALDLATRRAVARGAYGELTANGPDVLITACPLCKKSFLPVSELPVLDFAEAVANALIQEIGLPEPKRAVKAHHLQPVIAD